MSETVKLVIEMNFSTSPMQKKAMKANNCDWSEIVKIYSNGDEVNCGEIKLKGSNKTFIANTRQKVASY